MLCEEMSTSEQYRKGVAKVKILQSDFELHINIVAFWYLLLFFLEASAPSKWEATEWAPTTPTKKSAGKNQPADTAILIHGEKKEPQCMTVQAILGLCHGLSDTIFTQQTAPMGLTIAVSSISEGRE